MTRTLTVSALVTVVFVLLLLVANTALSAATNRDCQRGVVAACQEVNR